MPRVSAEIGSGFAVIGSVGRTRRRSPVCFRSLLERDALAPLLLLGCRPGSMGDPEHNDGRSTMKATQLRRRSGIAGLALTMFSVCAVSTRADAKPMFCSTTARMLFAACRASAADDTLVRKAVCLNVAASAARAVCLEQSDTERQDAVELCRGQRDTRLDTCKLLGEARYDPPIDPAAFDDPKNPTHPDPYFPLDVGHRWEYRAGTETDVVEIVDETKLIDGVHCIVARDVVSREGQVAEATDDWYAPAKDGSTWYFGEETKDFEVFPVDDPLRPELTSIDGTFKAGRNGDKPGIIFLATPHVGDVYVEEASLANAEDVTQILSTTYSLGSGAPELDELVPPDLAATFCSAGDCVVTKNFSLLEPGIFARKYYAKGIGVFLEVEPDEQKAVRLVNCNFDSRCVGLTP
jgi:hypothetical protein